MRSSSPLSGKLELSGASDGCDNAGRVQNAGPLTSIAALGRGAGHRGRHGATHGQPVARLAPLLISDRL
jgi:hypothetical protein